jgi:hypothetical protein
MGRRLRIWKPNSVYHVTLLCVDKMFLLKPLPEVNNAVGVALGRALEISSPVTGTHPDRCPTTGVSELRDRIPFAWARIEVAR